MPDPTAPRPETMNPEDVPAELIDLAMTGAKPGCRGDAAFYLANVLPAHERQVRERVAADIDAERAGGTEHWDVAMDHAARIARGES